MSSYGHRIKVLREAAGLTQEQLGKRIFTTGVTIMRYEKGQREPRFEQLVKIADALSISVNFLQATTPFENLDFLDSFKAVILSSLARHGMIELNDRAISEVNSYEYWKCISDHIVSIVQSGENELDIHYKNSRSGEADKAKFVIMTANLNFNELLGRFTSRQQMFAAYMVLRDFSELNEAGQQKLVERAEELREMRKYQL